MRTDWFCEPNLASLEGRDAEAGITNNHNTVHTQSRESLTGDTIGPSREKRPGANTLSSPDLSLLRRPLWMDQRGRAAEIGSKVGIQTEDRLHFEGQVHLPGLFLQPLP